MSSNIAHRVCQVYIPKILPGISRSFIATTFLEMDIGHITSFDIHHKDGYSFAFIEVQLDNSVVADLFENMDPVSETIQLVYDVEAGHYWEIRRHLPKELRSGSKQSRLSRAGPITQIMRFVSKPVATCFHEPLTQKRVVKNDTEWPELPQIGLDDDFRNDDEESFNYLFREMSAAVRFEQELYQHDTASFDELCDEIMALGSNAQYEADTDIYSVKMLPPRYYDMWRTQHILC
jgi:hypothetical protein